MGLRRVGTFVSHDKKKSGSAKPNERRDFYRRELFRAGDAILLLDRNPICMTPMSLSAISRADPTTPPLLPREESVDHAMHAVLFLRGQPHKFAPMSNECA